jgi:Phage integrase, N-terminal SAM-like domain
MSVRMRALVDRDGAARNSFQVLWRDAGGLQHGRSFRESMVAVAFDTAVRDGTLCGDAPGRAGGVGFEEAALHWLATKQATKRPRTVEVYRSELYTHVLPVFGVMGLAQIERRDVQAWVNALSVSGLGPTSVRHIYRTVLKAVLNNAVADGLLARSPCHRIELPAANRVEPEPLTAAQVLGIAARVPVTRRGVRAAVGRGGRTHGRSAAPGRRMPLGAHRPSTGPARAHRGVRAAEDCLKRAVRAAASVPRLGTARACGGGVLRGSGPDLYHHGRHWTARRQLAPPGMEAGSLRGQRSAAELDLPPTASRIRLATL